MAKISGYLEQRRAGWEAVVDVPPSVRHAVGRKRLRKGLGTRDKDVARALLPKALLELHARMDAARRASPATDPRTAEALAYRELGEALRRGDATGWAVVPGEALTTAGELVQQTVADAAEEVLTSLVVDRAEQIERVEGEARARDFADLAFGRTTPLTLHLTTWLSEPGKRGPRRQRTNDEFKGIVEAFAEWVAKEAPPATVEAVTRAVAGRYLGALHQRGLSPKRVRDVASALSGYWQWMERRGHSGEGRNPWPRQEVGGGKGDRNPDRDDARAFTNAELHRLLTGPATETMRDAMLLLALTGMRIEEVAALRVGSCAGGFFAVERGKTAAAKRRVPIHPSLTAVVERRTRNAAPDDWLFPELGKPDRYGRRSPTLDARLNRYREQLGVHDKPEGRKRSRVTVHSFRRWFITEALRAGQPERVVKQIVGHRLPKSDVTLGVYFGGDDESALRACVKAVRLPCPPP